MLLDLSKEVFSSIVGFSKDGTLMVSNVPKRKRAAVLLFTQQCDNTISSDAKS